MNTYDIECREKMQMVLDLCKFFPGQLVRMPADIVADRRMFRVIGRTLSDDERGLIGFFYSIIDTKNRTVFHDVAEYELEAADEQHAIGCRDRRKDTAKVSGEPSGSSADWQGYE